MSSNSKRVALITGGSRGIGFGIATVLANEGYDLAINGVREEAEVTEPLATLTSRGARVVYCRGNVAISDDRQQIVAKVREHFGRLDVLVNNAGVPAKPRADILDATEGSFDRVVGINLKGPYFLTQLVARWMIEQRKTSENFAGVIVNISSVSA